MTVFFRGAARTAPFPKVAYCEFQIDGARLVKRLGVVASLDHARREETHLRSAVYRQVHPEPLDGARLTLAAFWSEHFLPHLFPVPTENRRHVVSIGRQVTAALGPLIVAKVGRPDLLRWRDGRLKTVSVNQVHKERYWLRRMFRFAMAQEPPLLTKNPAADLPLPRYQRPKRRLLERHHDAALLAKIPDSRAVLRDMIELDLYTAMRRAEICGVRCGDVFLKERELRIFQTKTQEYKVIPLIPEALAIVKRHYRDGDPDAPLFLSPRRRRAYRPQTLWWAYADARRAAKLHGIRLHDIRHTVAMRLLSSMEVADVGDILGHRPPYKTTWLYVAHPNASRQRAGMAALRPLQASQHSPPTRRSSRYLRDKSRG